MSDTYTPNLNLTKPAVGGSRDTWGTKTNGDWDIVDAVFAGAGTGTSVGLNVGAGKTLSVAGTLTASGTVALPAAATAGGATIVSTTGTQTLTNKTLTNPAIGGQASYAAGTVSAPALTFTGDTNTGIYSPAADTIAFTEGGVEAMRIDSNANVGIGTSSPGARLAIQTAAGTAATQTIYTGSNAAAATLSFGQAGAVQWDTGITASSGDYRIAVNGGGTAYDIARSGTAIGYHAFSTGGTERMRIDASGNVGIGTNAPGTKLDIYDPASAGNPAVRIRDNVSDLRLYPSGGGSYVATISNTPLILNTNNTERLRVTETGNVGIGTSSPSTLLHLYNASVPAFRISNNTTALNTYVDANFCVTGSITSHPYIITTNNAERMRIDTSGNVGIATSTATGRLGVALSGSRTLGTAWDAASALFGSPGQFSGNLGLSFDTVNGATLESGAPGVASYPIRIAGSQAQFFTANAERMRIDASGNVGIGTSTPQGRFNVGGGRAFFGPNGEPYAIGIGFNQTRVNAGQTYYIGATDSTTPDMVFSNVFGSEAVRFTNAGNVGIGTSSPTGRLSVTNGDDARVKIFSNGGSVGVIDAVANTNDATGRWLSINPTGGNVGIGTSSPSATLDVRNPGGNCVISSQFGTGTKGEFIAAANQVDIRAYNGTNDVLTLTTGVSERFRVGPAGQFGVGGANYGTAGQVLTSNGSGAAPSWQSASANGLLLNVQVFTSSGTYTRTAGATRAVVIARGGGGGGVFNAGSGGAGGTTSFGSHVSAAGGSGGALVGSGCCAYFNPGAGGSGGTGSILSIRGQRGSASVSTVVGGNGGGEGNGFMATAGVRGGGGGSSQGAGGGQGELAIDYITSGLGATETVTIGAGGSAQTPGSSSAGGAGYIIVYEYS